jgi:ABC-type Zn2+ transport system substrate-binding protein/surface adhesin
MNRIVASIIIGLCIFLGNISGQAKTYKIVAHVSSEHSHPQKAHHHHDHHEHKHDKKESDSHDHDHSAELSLLTIHLALQDIFSFTYPAPVTITAMNGFYTSEVLNQLSFSPPVFRPPIV